MEAPGNKEYIFFPTDSPESDHLYIRDSLFTTQLSSNDKAIYLFKMTQFYRTPLNKLLSLPWAMTIGFVKQRGSR